MQRCPAANKKGKHMDTVSFSGNMQSFLGRAVIPVIPKGKPHHSPNLSTTAEPRPETPPPAYELPTVPSYSEASFPGASQHPSIETAEEHKDFQAWIKQHLLAYRRQLPDGAPLNERSFLNYLRRQSPTSGSPVNTQPQVITSMTGRTYVAQPTPPVFPQILPSPLSRQASMPNLDQLATQRAVFSGPDNPFSNAGDLIMPEVGAIESPVNLYRVPRRGDN